MRNPVTELDGTAMRVLRTVGVLTIVAAGVLFAGSGAAAAAPAEPNAVTFGLLGPVGMIAVVLGVLGMVAGVVRQRRMTGRPVADANQPVEPVLAEQPGMSST